MSKWLSPLLVLTACNFGHNRILEHEIDAPVAALDAAEPDAPEHHGTAAAARWRAI
jgi:hypothetical protein